ncbi:MAG: hybrid sensor histidine kinase/response regulator, partial [Myxococcaceae bacterium]|nr:hybrid sensor histidine kinase/response regulator [Myxococcaceae bacterium]
LETEGAQLAELLDTSRAGYCPLDASGYITSINGAGASLLGTPRERLLFRPLATALGLESRRSLQDHFDAASLRRATAQLEVKPKGPGAPVVLQLFTEKTPTGFRTAFLDVTRQRDLEGLMHQLVRAGELLSVPLEKGTVLSAITRIVVPSIAGACLVDLYDRSGALTRGAFTFADARSEAQFAPRLRDIVPLPPPISTGAARLRLEELGLAGELLRAAGLEGVLAAPLVSRDRPLGFVTLLAPVSRPWSDAHLLFAADFARRAAMAIDNALLDDTARVATTERDNLLSMIARELRNPLSVILLRLAQIAKREPDGDRRESKSLLEAVHDAANKLGRLAADLSDVSAELHVNKEKVPLKRVLDAALPQVEPLAAQQQQSIEVGPFAPGLNLQCDEPRMVQAITNLLEYLCEHAPDEATLSIQVETQGPFARLSVADDSGGLEPDELEHLFDRFWPHPRRARYGSGLGLSVAKLVAEAHGGALTAKSRLGEGVCFCLTVPLASASQRTVMVVDDDDAMRELLCEALRHEGYHVSAARNGADALAALKRTPVSVVLLDLTMPVMDGWGFLAERDRDERLKAIPVVAISAKVDDASRLTAANADYVPKPLHIDELLRTIEQRAVTT